MCTERRILLLELTDADGVEVWAECVAGEQPNYSAETIDTAWHAITGRGSRRACSGSAFDRPGRACRPALERDFRGHSMAKAAVEMGCWALAASARGVPLARLLGGTRDRIADRHLARHPGRSGGAGRARAARRSAGYRKIKLKIQPGADVEFVAAVRAAFGPDDRPDGRRQLGLHPRRRRAPRASSTPSG